jgi:hypothetical protein
LGSLNPSSTFQLHQINMKVVLWQALKSLNSTNFIFYKATTVKSKSKYGECFSSKEFLFSKLGNFFAPKKENSVINYSLFYFILHILASVIWHPSSRAGVLKNIYSEYHIMKEFIKKTSDNFDMVLYKGFKVGAFLI